jgi:hypothetical protein
MMNPNNLYEKDFYLWTEETAQFLKERIFDRVDIENLIEEVESMGRSEKNALKSNLRILLMHLLKWNHQSDKRSNSWKYTIVEHRLRILESLNTSPSLKKYLEEVLEECYLNACKLASTETGLPRNTFPQSCPLTTEQLLNEELFEI